MSSKRVLEQHMDLIEGSLEVQLPTIWTDGKVEVGRVIRSEKRKGEKKEVAGARKGREAAILCVLK